MIVLDASLIPSSSSPINGRRVPGNWHLELLLDHIPSREKRLYRKVQLGNRTLYISVIDGIGDFFLHNPQDGTGYGGRTFEGRLVNGESFSVKGPWSSHTGVANRYLPDRLHGNVSATESREVFERGFTFYSISGVTMDVIHQALHFLPGWTFIESPQTQDKGFCDELDGVQNLVVTGEVSAVSGDFCYTDGIPVCPTCEGAGFVIASKSEPGAFRSTHSEYTRACPDCGRLGVLAGVLPVPGMRWCGKVIR